MPLFLPFIVSFRIFWWYLGWMSLADSFELSRIGELSQPSHFSFLSCLHYHVFIKLISDILKETNGGWSLDLTSLDCLRRKERTKKRKSTSTFLLFAR